MSPEPYSVNEALYVWAEAPSASVVAARMVLVNIVGGCLMLLVLVVYVDWILENEEMDDANQVFSEEDGERDHQSYTLSSLLHHPDSLMGPAAGSDRKHKCSRGRCRQPQCNKPLERAQQAHALHNPTPTSFLVRSEACGTLDPVPLSFSGAPCRQEVGHCVQIIGISEPVKLTRCFHRPRHSPYVLAGYPASSSPLSPERCAKS